MDDIFAHRNPQAEAAQEGPLQGLRVAVQACISVAGWPAEAGSTALANYKALEDAAVVERLRRSGAALCGSTRTSEFGFGLTGSRAGGALQNGASDLELVLDLMGESRLAASRAGVIGFKPSYGIVSRYGLIGLIPSMECCGLLSESPARIRETLKAIAGPDDRDFSLPEEPAPDLSHREMNPAATTLGVIREAVDLLTAEEEARFRSGLEELERAGFTVRDVSLPDFPLFQLVGRIVGSVEASSCAGRYDSVRYGERTNGARNWNDMYLQSRGAAFGLLLKSCLFQGAFFQFQRYDAYEDACRIRARLLKEAQRIAEEADFLVLPTVHPGAPDAPASLDDTYRQFAFTVFANVTGQPALHLPPAAGGADAGFQLAGPGKSDGRLLDLGEHILERRQRGA